MGTVILILVIGLVAYPLLFIGPALLAKYDKDLEDVFPLFKKRNQPRFLEEDRVYFPSRRSLSLTVLFGVILLLLLAQTGFTGRLLPVLVFLLVALLACWLNANTGYTVSNTQLLIRSLFLRRKVDLASLRKVCRSNNPLASPALSLKRLEITTVDGDLIIISPVEEDLFLRILKERSPNLIIK